jgi:sarcosine oxidase
MNHFDVIVIGLGGWGSATLYHLARAGRKVCGVEQFSIGHDRGSSHGESRIIRMAYFLHPDYVPVLRRSYELWRALELEWGEPLMDLNGLLCFGPPNGELARGLAASYAAHSLPHERLSAAEAMQRFPQFRIAERSVCYWDPMGGYLRPERCLHAHVQGAQAAGASLLQGEPVLALERDGAGMAVQTNHRTLRAEKVVLAGGAFTNWLLGMLDGGAPVQPVRKVLFWYRMAQAPDFAPQRFPCWIAEDGGRAFYGFPTLDWHELKAAEDSGGQTLENLTDAARDPLPEDEPRLREFLQRTFGEKIGERARHRTCLYEMTADRHFIVDRHPRFENVIIAAGGSGHGYKLCPAIGELAAALAMGGAEGRPGIFRVGGRMG